jgi:predicted Zn-dependent protease
VALRRKLKDPAAQLEIADALNQALTGNCREAQEASMHAIALSHEPKVLEGAATAIAICGTADDALALGADLSKLYPKSTLVHAIWLPVIRASVELRRANPQAALHLLEPVMPYERASQFWPAHLRGMAYLQLQKPSEASAQFHRILDHRGEGPLSMIYPLAQLGLARSAAQAGDMEESRKAYQDLFALWKNADRDFPILLAAKKEYAHFAR